MSLSSRVRRPSLRWTAAAGLVVLSSLGLGYAVVQFTGDSDSHPARSSSEELASEKLDPAKLFKSPFLNAKKGVAYVGDAACASCHQEIAKSFHAHPMGQSAEWMKSVRSIEKYDETAKSSFTSSGFDFRIEKKGNEVVHRLSAKANNGDALPDYARSVDIAIGSGAQGRTYLTIEKGAVWQSPVSWYSKAGRWDISPIPDLDDGGRRPVIPGCLYCHANNVAPIPGAINRYREPVFSGQVSIGCERCHGPGALHVAERNIGRAPEGIDYSIVNPKHLSTDLKTDICRQCHLQGLSRITRREKDTFDYRPGLPWDQFVSTFVMRPELANNSKSVGQFEQMEMSKCFSGSKGALSCVSCHDPHVKPEPKDSVQFYRGRCMTCHETKKCAAAPAERTAQADSCIACHMPTRGSSNVVHLSITDHQIPRLPGKSASNPKKSGSQNSGIPLLPYPPGPHAPSRDERDRDLSIAIANAVQAVPQARPLSRLAEQKLLESVTKWPSDEEAWISLSEMRKIGGNRRGAEEAALRAVRLNPKSEAALTRLAAESRNSGDLVTALSVTNSLVTMSPTNLNYPLSRADVYVQQRDWVKAEADARAALALQPLSGKARFYLAVCLHHRGDPAGAENEAATAVKLIPTARLREEYSHWFKEQIKAAAR